MLRVVTINTRGITVASVLLFFMLAGSGCTSLSYYSGSSASRDEIKQVLLLHAQSVIHGHVPGHAATHTIGAVSAGPFTGDRVDDVRPMDEEGLANSAQPLTSGRMPPERDIIGKVRLTRVDIKFMRDNVAFATFREVGLDGMDRRVYQHDVAAFLTREGREWKIYAMAAGDIVFDHEGLDKDWYLAPDPERRMQDVQ